MDTFLLKNLSGLLQTGIFYVEKGSTDEGWKTSESNPLCRDKALRDMLVQRADMQELPFLYRDEFQVYFGCVATEAGYCMVGPMSMDFFDRLKRHKFYQKYHIPEHCEKNLRRFTLMEVLQTMCITARIVSGKAYTDQQIVDANHLASVTKEQEEEDKIRFNLQSDEEDIYRHSYQEEPGTFEHGEGGKCGGSRAPVKADGCGDREAWKDGACASSESSDDRGRAVYKGRH